MKRNWKTTVCGVLMIVGALCGAGVALLDGDPSTAPNLTLIIATITAGVGLSLSKDGDK